MLRYLSFALWEGAVSLWRSRMLNLLSIGTIMFAMFILGAFILVSTNLESFTVSRRDQIQFHAFLLDSVTEPQVAAIAALLDDAEIVERYEHISREEARERFGQGFPAYRDVVDTLEESPFPASFRVVSRGGTDRAAFDGLRDRLSEAAGVEEVFYDADIVSRLDFFIHMIRVASLFFGLVMVASSIFTISNVLKLTFFTRREEVDIMKLVGASRAYIRGPFIVEGILIGLAGALFGVALVYAGFLIGRAYLTDSAFLMMRYEPVFLEARWIGFLLLAGAFSGLLGSLISLHQFLEEHISYQ